MLRQAIAADASYFPPHLRLSQIYSVSGKHLELRRLYSSMPASPIVECMRAFVSAPAGYRVHAYDSIAAIEKRLRPTACTAYMRAHLTSALRPASARAREQLSHTTRAMQLLAEVAMVAVLHAKTQWANGSRAAGDSTLRRAAINAHVLERIRLLSTLRSEFARRGDARAALATKREIQDIAARDSRPGVAIAALDPWQESGAQWRHAMQRQIAIARREHARVQELGALLALGNEAINSGDNAAALEYLDQAAVAAEKANSAGYRMLVYRLRGRAYSKVGDVARARRDLESAIALYPLVQDDYELAETYHNLGHVYEGAGQLTKAAAAMDRFVELTRQFVHAQPKVMSLHDAAEIRWKAGWHASADVALSEMVRVIDTQQSNHYWAGEYFERTGDYAKAKQYYLAGVRSGAELSLNYAGLTRVYETLGAYDSANIAAERHDRVMADQFDTPLRPNLLLRLGRADDALRIARAWVNTKSSQKHVQGEARARNALAELYLTANRPAEALTEAQHAQKQAARLNLALEQATARRLNGLALARSGQPRAAVTELQRAAKAVKGVASIEERRLTHMALAEALSLAGDTIGALVEYRRAASQVDTISAGLIEDMTRARFRSNQQMPFDRALALLLASPRPNVAQLIDWSQRRKASALSFGVAPPRVRELRDIQKAILPDEAVIDFIMVDKLIAALVLTRSSASATVLPAEHTRVKKLIERVRAPLLRVHGGRIDLARAPFDGAAAHELYRQLLQPLLRNVTAQRLTIAPDDVLHGVVYDALVTDADGSFLIERYTVRQIPSLALLNRTLSLPRAPSALIVSRKTPGLAREVAGVRSSLSRARLAQLDGAAATEQAVQQRRSGFDILHVATHARADERDAMGSFLELEPAGEADGFLHVTEIADRQAANALVVLSACETLGGPLFAGEGVMGVARAFLTSGARSVIATTWPVGAATADLMSAFYRGLNEGQAVPDALRAAKLTMRRNRATAHPFFWASFVLVTK